MVTCSCVWSAIGPTDTALHCGLSAPLSCVRATYPCVSCRTGGGGGVARRVSELSSTQHTLSSCNSQYNLMGFWGWGEVDRFSIFVFLVDLCRHFKMQSAMGEERLMSVRMTGLADICACPSTSWEGPRVKPLPTSLFVSPHAWLLSYCRPGGVEGAFTTDVAPMARIAQLASPRTTAGIAPREKNVRGYCGGKSRHHLPNSRVPRQSLLLSLRRIPMDTPG